MSRCMVFLFPQLETAPTKQLLEDDKRLLEPQEACFHLGRPSWRRVDPTNWGYDFAVGQNQLYHFRVGAPPILEPILVGIGMFTGGTIWLLTQADLYIEADSGHDGSARSHRSRPERWSQRGKSAVRRDQLGAHSKFWGKYRPRSSSSALLSLFLGGGFPY